jgi:hypothetical protein
MNCWKMENESGAEVERWGARGADPEGESGLILLAERSASALYLRWNLNAIWGVQLGDTVSPCVSPSVDRIGHHMSVPRAVCGYRMCWLGLDSLKACFCRLRTCCVARAGLQWARSGLPRCKKSSAS